jgi:hypothetical protein
MIKFELSAEEISALKQQIPNLDVILKALFEHPKIEVISDDEDWADCFKTAM